MTKKFNVRYTCPHCGKQASAETAFGRWMRNEPRLDSGDGIIRTDCDHIICRYKTAMDGRKFQLLMIVEVKEYGAEPDESQRDLLLLTHQSLFVRQRNMYDAPTVRSLKLYSVRNNTHILARHFGVFLLQFEKTSPCDSAWIKWNRAIIDERTLIEILSFHRRPDRPAELMEVFLRDRHARRIDLNLDLVYPSPPQSA